MMKKSLPPIKSLLGDTYLAVIKNSVGSKIWRNFYIKAGNKKIDIMKDGDLSCAFFVSSILTLFDLIKKIHGTVDGIIFDLEKSDWKKVKNNRVKIKPGSVIVWQAEIDKMGESHKHIGFYLGHDRAVSNSSKFGQIAEHHFTFGTKNDQPVRAIEAIYTHKKLN